MSEYHVVTTIMSPTAITCAVKGNFIYPDKENLIISKGTKIEIYSILNEGIELYKHFDIYGFIRKLHTCTIPGRNTCSLFILTEKNYYTIISYDVHNSKFVTENHGLLEHSLARETEEEEHVVVDPRTNMIHISAHTGFIFSIPFWKKPDLKGKSRESRHEVFSPIPVRTYEFDFLSMVALKGIKASQIAVLVGRINEIKTIKSMKFQTIDDQLHEDVTVQVEATTHTLIAVPDPIGGVLAIGEYIISYHDLLSSGSAPKELSIDPVIITAHTFLNNSYTHCIIGDSEGTLYMLTLEINNMKVNSISSTIIGKASIPNSIVDLGNQLFYIGSSQADPCIIRLITQGQDKFSIEVLNTFPSLAPILDFCLFDYDQQGKQTMVCCSGVDKESTLRVVEYGVEFNVEGQLDIPLINDVWAFSSNNSESNDTLLVSKDEETCILKSANTNEINYAFMLDTITRTITMTKAGYLLQVTPFLVRLIQANQILDEWKPPKGQEIKLAKANSTTCIVCYEDGILVYLDCTGNTLREICVRDFVDISCINISVHTENGTPHDYVLISMLTQPRVMILRLETLSPIMEFTLESSIRAADLLMIKLESTLYFMILSGDGQLQSCEMQFKENKFICQKKKSSTVGTYCTGMYPYYHTGQQKVFISGSQPTVITSFNDTLFFSTVNLKNIRGFCLLNDRIVLTTDHGILWGQIDVLQKLHHTRIDLGNDMPTRIQYMKLAKALAVSTISICKNEFNELITRKGKLQILDALTFKAMDSCELLENEIVESMTMAQFREYPNQEYLFVGTAIEDTEEGDINHGRILVFNIKENQKIELIEEVEEPGVVYSIKAFQNSVVAGIDDSIYCLEKFSPDLRKGDRIQFCCNRVENVLPLHLDTRGNQVLVGDLMQSMYVLRASKNNPVKLELAANDSEPAWMTSVKFVNDRIYIGADDGRNLFTLSAAQSNKENDTSTHDKNGSVIKMEWKGGFHVGSMINRMRSDTISSSVVLTGSNVSPYENPFTFVTVAGSIGTVKSISLQSFKLLRILQEGVLSKKENIGGLKYHEWRMFKPKIGLNTRHSPHVEASNYIDGDIINEWIQLPIEAKKEIISQSPVFSEKTIKDIDQFVHSLIY
ncbi:CPSF A subunit region-domain-containing protein [Cokeromyces recurvatus]|uniref:CPSF A subunit region-domain-containing protein n=1 Tax=Cokeromyces recurvatus TaxID=90255 RepID=UPI00222044E5|nr:CPSF A subunit region-domain-containing protein [Cokeromyces recurvatus]KAI7899232.1 CPSF A subunit region-domain-containing protein [Cokeromyces recurvatus]